MINVVCTADAVNSQTTIIGCRQLTREHFAKYLIKTKQISHMAVYKL